MSLEKHPYRTPVILTIITIALGASFYHFFEQFSWVDAYYFTVGTMFTVGYGDLAPSTDLGKIFTTFYMFIGVGIIGGFIRAIFHHRLENSKITYLHRNDESGQ
ncbi:MAG: potassium channel family protein [Candidatus Saccharimonadales bacterium]